MGIFGLLIGAIALGGRAISDSSKNRKADKYIEERNKMYPAYTETLEEFKARSTLNK